MSAETTLIDGFVNCNNCGAHAPKGTPIKHHSTCKPGEAARWEEHYAAEEEDSGESS